WPRTPSAQALGVPAMSAGGRRGVLGSSMSLRRSAGQRRGKAGARVSMRHGLGGAILIMGGEPACRALIPSGGVAARRGRAWGGRGLAYTGHAGGGTGMQLAYARKRTLHMITAPRGHAHEE